MESFKDIVQASFLSLKESIDELRKAFERAEDDSRERKERLVTVERDMCSIVNRVDKIEKKIDRVIGGD